jgi:hypothetical protein
LERLKKSITIFLSEFLGFNRLLLPEIEGLSGKENFYFQIALPNEEFPMETILRYIFIMTMTCTRQIETFKI